MVLRTDELELQRQESGDAGRSRSRSPIPQIDPLRDLSPPRWTRTGDDEDEEVSLPQGHSLVQMPGMTSESGTSVPMMGGMGMMPNMVPMMGGMPTGMPGMMGGGMGMPVGMGNMAGMPGGLPGVGNMGMMGNMGMVPMGNLAMMGMNGMGGMMGGMGSMGSMGNMVPMAMGAAAQGQMQAFVVGAQQEQEQAYAKAMAVIKAGAGPASEEVGSGIGTSVPRTDPNHHAYRPPNTEPIPGVTDRRWEGYIRLFIEDELHGYGFIKCTELRKKFPDKDVFLHRNQRAGFKQGDTVSFSVFMNFRGMPQATDLKKPHQKTEEDDG